MQKKISIGLFGFGKTGKAVASVLAQNEQVSLKWVVKGSAEPKQRSANEILGIDVAEETLIYSKEEFKQQQMLEQQPVDVLIDFSSQDGISHYASEAIRTRTPVVSAISHYTERSKKYLNKIAKSTSVLWSPNITVGVNFLIIASKVLQQIAPQTDIEIIEEHFKAKPELSGTAKKIASALEIPEDQIKMIRAGGIIGRHETLFGFPHQTVRISHESISREAFGSGALFAAKSIVVLTPGLYTMEDLLKPFFNLC